MLITRKCIALIVIAAFMWAGNASGSRYLAPSSAVQDGETLEDFSKTVDALGSAKEKKGIPVGFLKDGFIETELVSKERFLKLKAENKIAPVMERIVQDPDTGEEVPEETYAHNDVIAYMLEHDIIKKAHLSPKTFKYVSVVIAGRLLEMGWLRHALLDRRGAASYGGDKVLVYRDGLRDADLRQGVRMHTISLLVSSFDTPGAEEMIRSAFEIAQGRYGNTVSGEGQYLIDEALNLAMTVTQPVDVKVGPELAAAALLFAADPGRKAEQVPGVVWGWIRTFQELNSLEFMPPLTMRPKVREVYIENFRNYMTKYAGDAVQPLLLLMAYRMDHFLIEREEMGAGFYERYDLLISVYAMLAEQLGLKRFSDSMNRLSYRKAHEKEYRAILRQVNRTFGVYYQDLSVFGDIFREQVAKEIKDLEKKTGRKIEAEVDFGVKDPGSIDEKIKFYAKKLGLSLKNPLDGIRDLQDLVRGRIIVRNKDDLALMRKLPFAQKISPGDKLKATAVARKITGEVPAIEDVVDRKTLQDIFRRHRSPVAVKEALDRLAQARAGGKAPLYVELQMQTVDMRRKEFTGAVLHSFYKMRKIGLDLLPPDEVYEKTANLAERLRSINREPQVADIEFIRCRYHRRTKEDEIRTVEFIHNVPKRLSDKGDRRPAVID
ncbi:MAG TPA: hypothetical protein P5287_07235, partial [bacterium]|nr:hypothetical protein [bacterium]